MPDIGTEVILQAEFRNRDGVLEDPDTIEGWIRDPRLAVTSLVFTKKSVGIWEATFTPTLDGDHWWRVETLGTGIRVAEEKKLEVEKQLVVH